MNFILGWLGKIGAAAGALLALLFYASRQGRKAERAEQTERALEQSKEGNRVDKDVRRRSDSDLDERLRKHTRD